MKTNIPPSPPSRRPKLITITFRPDEDVNALLKRAIRLKAGKPKTRGWQSWIINDSIRNHLKELTVPRWSGGDTAAVSER